MKKKLSLLLAAALMLNLAACGTAQEKPEATPTAAEPTAAQTAYTAGTYEASAPGHNGPITVAVTFSDSAIEKVEVKDHAETDGVADLAIAQIGDEIAQYQSLAVDAVSGATMTSNAILRAAADAIRQAGGDTDALKKAPVAKPAPEAADFETQVLVVGGGISGIIAAITAADQGADVTLVEKLDILGGSFLVSASAFTTVDSDHVTDADDSLEHVLEFVRKANTDSVHQPDYDFLSTVLSQSGETIDYFIDGLGLEASSMGGGNYVNTMFIEGPVMLKDLIRIMNEKGVKVLLGTAAQELVTSEGAVVGAKVKNDGGQFTITADKVIIAAGGSSWDKETLTAKNPALATVKLNEKASIGNTGDGPRMLEAIGAQVDDTLLVKSSNIDFCEQLGYTWKNLPGVAKQLLVDSKGERFGNEAPAASTMVNVNMLRHPDTAYYGIFDTVNTDPTLLADLEKLAQENAGATTVVYAETIEGLADQLGMDPQTLQATFDRYQQLCADKADPDFGKGEANLIPYATEGGYYAAYLRPASWGTIGGVITDDQMRVLDTEGAVIPNVFAVGESATSRLFGDYYLGGFSLGLYSTMGRIAAETAVSELTK